MVRFSDELGSGTLETAEDVRNHFVHRIRSRPFNETWFYYENGDEDFPQIAMLSTTQHAYLTYFESSDGRFFTSCVVNAGDPLVTFRVHGEMRVVPPENVIPLDDAEAALAEFVQLPSRPGSIWWTDPLPNESDEQPMSRRSMQTRRRRREA